MAILADYIFVQTTSSKGGVSVYSLGDWEMVESVLPGDWDSTATLTDMEVTTNGSQIILMATLDTLGLGLLTMITENFTLKRLGKDSIKLLSPIPAMI